MTTTLVHKWALTGDIARMRTGPCFSSGFLEALSTLDENGETPLYIATKLGHRRFVQAVLHTKPEVLHIAIPSGQTPLMVAIRKGWKDIVLDILTASENKNVDAVDKKGRSALYFAIKSKVMDKYLSTYLLFTCGSKSVVREQEPLLSVALKANHRVAFGALMATEVGRATINSMDLQPSPLFLAVQLNNQAALKSLLPHCSRETLCRADCRGSTPVGTAILLAARDGDNRSLKQLMRAKAPFIISSLIPAHREEVEKVQAELALKTPAPVQVEREYILVEDD